MSQQQNGMFQMLEQMQLQQQAMMASVLGGNGAQQQQQQPSVNPIEQLGPSKLLVNGGNLFGLPMPIVQMTSSASYDEDYAEMGGYGEDDECSTCRDENSLINSQDFGDVQQDDEAGDGYVYGSENYMSCYCCANNQVEMMCDESESEECLTMVGESVECVEFDVDDSSSSESDCCPSHGVTTIITLKHDETGAGGGGSSDFAEKSTTAVQTAPMMVEVGVQKTDQRTTFTETDPPSNEILDTETFDRLLALGPKRSQTPLSFAQRGRQVSDPQMNRVYDPNRPAGQASFHQSRTMPNFEQQGPHQPQPQIQGGTYETEQAEPQQWRTSQIMSNVRFEKEPNIIIKEAEPVEQVVVEEKPREPIWLKFDLGLRIDSVRNMPHLLAAPHNNTEHYCAYCTPETESVIRPPLLLKARLTVYDRRTGHLTDCADGLVNSETNWSLTNVRFNRYVFGRQSAVFPKANLSQDSILIVRLYARPKKDLFQIDPSYTLLVRQAQMDATDPADSEDDLVGWSVMHIWDAWDEGKDEEVWQLKTGLQLLPVYCPPLPMIIQIPPQHAYVDSLKTFRRLGAHSTVAVWVGRGPFKNLDDSSEEEDPDDDEEVRRIDKKLWVDGGPQPRLTEPFTAADGFDLYVDSARCLPDFVTISKVSVRILQANHAKAASDEFCYSQLDSDIFNPIFNYRIEYRKLSRELVPRSTLTFKLYTIDRFTHKLTVVGYAYLNLFNNLGVVGQPIVDEGIQVTLNEGSFQVRIYATAPDQKNPMSVHLPINDKHRPWPCATLLVRIVKAPRDDFGQVLTMAQVPEANWVSTGLLKHRPKNYPTGGYISKICKPSVGERQTFATFRRRLPFEVRRAVVEIGREMTDRTIPEDNDTLLQGVLERLLSRFGFEGEIPHGYLDFAAAYDPVYGFAVSVDSAMGLPWAGATFAHLVVNPPAAHYLGPPFSRFDTPKFLAHLNLNCPPSCPQWVDGFITFSHRAGQRMQSTGLRVYTTVIVHLQEVTIRRTYLNFEYGLSSEAWAIVPIFSSISTFSHPYVANQKLLLPIFSGPPNKTLLKEMSEVADLEDWIDNCIHVKKLHPVVGARLNVRVSDARRTEECSISEDFLPFNNRYATLPSILEAEPPSMVPFLPPALTTIPLKSYVAALVANDQKFIDKITSTLPAKYRQMVFKLYYSKKSK